MSENISVASAHEQGTVSEGASETVRSGAQQDSLKRASLAMSYAIAPPEDQTEQKKNPHPIAAHPPADSQFEGQASGPRISEISAFVETLQRILQNGSKHIEFNIRELEKKETNDASDDNFDGDSDEEDRKDTKAPDQDVHDKVTGCQCTACINEKIAPGKPISHAIDFADDEGGFIMSRDRKKPLNLRAQHRRRTKQKASSIFTLVTVVKTSLLAETRKYAPWVTQEFIKRNPLNDPKTSISFHTHKLILLSPAILEALRNVLLYYPDLNLRGERVSITSPYSALAHHLDDLKSYRDMLRTSKDQHHSSEALDREKREFPPEHEIISTTCNKTAAEHLTRLLDYLDSDYGDRIQMEKVRNERGLCTFAMLWLLFKPGTTIYTREDPADLPTAMVIKSVETDPAILFRNDNEREPYVLEVWYLDFDGRKVGRRLHSLELEQFHGERSITSLKVFPAHVLDREDDSKTKMAIVARGERWFDLLKGKMVMYDGRFIGDRLAKPFQGRVYVDYTSYWSETDDEAPDLDEEIDNDPSCIGGCICSACVKEKSDVQKTRLRMWEAYKDIDPFVTESLKLESSDIHMELGVDVNHRYLVCSSVLGCLNLISREWKKIDAGCCSDVHPKSKAIENLVMKKSRKDMIKALLHNYSTETGHPGKAPAAWSADFIENKGDGRIILLHGPPGVGKTYTAECIAEYTGRPLISLTCGDIGTREQDIEENISTWFNLGEKWGAVMLIDEADVYLESRKPGDLERNGLVSVFLRAVEYYNGILFLTTNRVGQFDDAFISRIHVVLRYKRLSLEDRKQIWEGFFDKLETERGTKIRTTKQAKKYVLEDPDMVKIPWNGREIRNAFQTAVALAQYKFAIQENKDEGDKAELDKTHFEEVCAMASSFKKYLKRVHRQDEEGLAAIHKYRNELGGASDSDEED